MTKKRRAKVSFLTIFLVLGISALLIGGGFFMFGGKVAQTSLLTGKVTAEETSGNIATNLGVATNLKTVVFEKEAVPDTQVGMRVHYWVIDGTTRSYRNGITTASGTTDLATTVGMKMDMIPFNTTYPYGDKVEGMLVDKENKPQNLYVHLGAINFTTVFYKNGVNVTSLTVGAGETADLDRVEFKNADDYSMIRVKGFALGLPDATNVSEIKIGGMSEAGSLPKRIKDAGYDLFYTIDAGVQELHGFDKFVSGAIQIKSDGDDVSETMTYTWVDEAPFINEANELSYGVQDDTSSHADVGLADAGTGSFTLV